MNKPMYKFIRIAEDDHKLLAEIAREDAYRLGPYIGRLIREAHAKRFGRFNKKRKAAS